MSGAWVSYHLRQNKAVDRMLFIDLLSKLNRYIPIPSYEYIGFGGAFLEDHKLIHSHFGNMNLTSIEMDDHVWERQKFNLPLNCIKRAKTRSNDFIDSFNPSNPSIIWLDYANPNERRDQLMELQRLLPKLDNNDVVKITLNANPQTILPDSETKPDGKRYTQDEALPIRLDRLNKKLGDYLPQNVTPNEMTKKKFPSVLCRAIEYAANKGMESRRSKSIFQPLTAFSYADSEHQMLTVTGIILERNKITEFFKKTNVKKWKLATSKWGEFQEIKVPSLTVREKMFLDQMLPNSTASAIHKKLKFQFDKKENESLEVINSYKKYYRYYPNFQKVHF